MENRSSLVLEKWDTLSSHLSPKIKKKKCASLNNYKLNYVGLVRLHNEGRLQQAIFSLQWCLGYYWKT